MTKLKYRIPTSLDHVPKKIVAVIAFIGLVIALLTLPVNAMKQPEEYGLNQCERIAKDFCNDWKGGSCSLVWIQPLTDSGALELGDFAAHLVNKAWSKDTGLIYVDWQAQAYFQNETEIQDWYYYNTGKNSIIYDLSRGRPP
ncbi:MAG TPA: hypothetical protein DHV62_09095, partial [Elusimicrobia bacterium]|nr:hypothetical protein [Elusimicrobiota bacterium]